MWKSFKTKNSPCHRQDKRCKKGNTRTSAQKSASNKRKKK